MSYSEIVMPQLGLTMTEGIVVEWHVNVGDLVVAGAPIVTIESDKALEEVAADVSGRLIRIDCPIGGAAKIGQVIGVVEKS